MMIITTTPTTPPPPTTTAPTTTPVTSQSLSLTTMTMTTVCLISTQMNEKRWVAEVGVRQWPPPALRSRWGWKLPAVTVRTRARTKARTRRMWVVSCGERRRILAEPFQPPARLMAILAWMWTAQAPGLGRGLRIARRQGLAR